MPGAIEFFKGDDGKTYFRVIAANGSDELVRSTDGYERPGGAREGLQALLEVFAAYPEETELRDLTARP